MMIHHFQPGARFTTCGLNILVRKGTLPLTCTRHRITCKNCLRSPKKIESTLTLSYIKAKG